MKITVAGAGAMGCRFGAALFEAGLQVTLLDYSSGNSYFFEEKGASL